MPESVKTLSATLDKLTSLVASFSQEQFNVVPFEGSWTAARVTQHLYLALKGMPSLLAGPAVPAERAPDEKVEQFKAIFLNMDTKFQSPDFIFPEDKQYDRDALLKLLKDLRLAIVAASEGQELSLLTNFELPGMGRLTKLESIWFSVYHTQRHIWQIENIQGKF